MVTGLSQRSIQELARSGIDRGEMAKFLEVPASSVDETLQRYGLFEEWKSAANARGTLWTNCSSIAEREEFRNSRGMQLTELVRLGWNQGDIGNALHVSGERVRQLLHDYGMYELWKQTNKEGKKEGRMAVLALVKFRRNAHMAQLDWPHRTAVLYMERIGKFSYAQYEQLATRFQVYHNAKERGETLSLEELAGSEFWPAQMGKILRYVGLAPMHGHHRKLTQRRRAVVRDMHRLPLSSEDISYFAATGVVAPWALVRRMQRCQRPNPHLYWSPGLKLPYRTASQIYEAADCGFTPEQTPELLDCRQKVVTLALEHRPEYEKRIVLMLRALFRAPEISVPYVSSTEREQYVAVLSKHIENGSTIPA